jgi:hypothetical protein
MEINPNALKREQTEVHIEIYGYIAVSVYRVPDTTHENEMSKF